MKLGYSHLNQSDKNLVDDIAAYWIADGGDAEGFSAVSLAIHERIADLRPGRAGVEENPNRDTFPCQSR